MLQVVEEIVGDSVPHLLKDIVEAFQPFPAGGQRTTNREIVPSQVFEEFSEEWAQIVDVRLLHRSWKKSPSC